MLSTSGGSVGRDERGGTSRAGRPSSVRARRRRHRPGLPGAGRSDQRPATGGRTDIMWRPLRNIACPRHTYFILSETVPFLSPKCQYTVLMWGTRRRGGISQYPLTNAQIIYTICQSIFGWCLLSFSHLNHLTASEESLRNSLKLCIYYWKKKKNFSDVKRSGLT